MPCLFWKKPDAVNQDILDNPCSETNNKYDIIAGAAGHMVIISYHTSHHTSRYDKIRFRSMTSMTWIQATM